MGSTTFAALYAYAQRKYLDRADTQALVVVKEAVNRAMKRIAKTDHPYFSSRGVINLVAPITSGTVSVNKGATTVSGSSTSWTSATTIGRSMIIDAEEYHFGISSFASAATITFANSAKWLNASVTGKEYTIYKDVYDLPSDFRSLGKIMKASELAAVKWLPSISDWYRLKMKWHSMTGRPVWGCLANGKIWLWPHPDADEIEVLSFPYFRWPTTMSSDSDQMDFDDNQIELVYRAIEVEIAIERGKGRTTAKEEFDECLREMLGAVVEHETFVLGGAGYGIDPFPYVVEDDP